MRFCLKGQAILEKSGLKNSHQLALRARISAPTASKFIIQPENVKYLDTEVLARMLVDGCGLTPEQILDMRLGDIFELK